MFVDEVKVYARAGHGGKGAVAFLRETFRPKGGPSGGNGGKGGDVILEADHDYNNLIDQYYSPRLIADPGQGGMGKGMDGKAGKDLIIKVPCGTLVWRLRDTTPPLEPGSRPRSQMPPPPEPDVVGDESADDGAGEDQGRPGNRPKLAPASHLRGVIRSSGGVRAMELDLSAEDDGGDSGDGDSGGAHPTPGELVCDLTQHGQRFVLCKGGRGGLGNRNFATSRRQAPRFAQPGEPGTEGDYLLELRIMADVGIVGYPNAGKSTLLTAISKARPKIAPYPFTTLTPQIGIVEYPDWHRLTVCDVPGLIEGAHLNVGLGHAFLRHLRRCQVLVFLLDMAGTDNRTPWDDYRSLLAELEQYDAAFLDKPRLVVANKMDEPHADANLKTFKRKVRKTAVLPISAAFDEGIEAFRTLIREAVTEARSADAAQR